jgi:hypothetical protein
MPMDEYDSGHKVVPDFIIDIYENSKIDEVLDKYISSFDDDILHSDYFIDDIKKTITLLRKSLDVLDRRIITNIGGRVFFIKKSDLEKRNDDEWMEMRKWCLVQVWKGYL